MQFDKLNNLVVLPISILFLKYICDICIEFKK